MVYDDRSGDTLKLDVMMAEALRRLLQTPATTTELSAHLATTFAVDSDLKLLHWVRRAVERFSRLGLIEPVQT